MEEKDIKVKGENKYGTWPVFVFTAILIAIIIVFKVIWG